MCECLDAYVCVYMCVCVWRVAFQNAKSFWHLRFVQFLHFRNVFYIFWYSVFTAHFIWIVTILQGRQTVFFNGGWIAHFGMKSSLCSFVPSHSPAVSLLSNKVHSECHNATDPFLDWYLFICLFISESLLFIDFTTIPRFLLCLEHPPFLVPLFFNSFINHILGFL